MEFKVGDEITKARPYSLSNYCRCGGRSDNVPIGTKGVITGVEEYISVLHIDFENGEKWAVDMSEISLININWREKLKCL